MNRDPWAILGVPRSADDKMIKKAYRELARSLHPDRNKDNPEAAARFQDLAHAYETIRDEDSRKRWIYDNERGKKREAARYPLHLSFREALRGSQKEVLIEVETVCSLCGGTGAAPGHAPRRCASCDGTGEVTLGHVSTGCSECAGAGYKIDHPCSQCQRGLVREQKNVWVSTPPGVYDGYELILRENNTEICFQIDVEKSQVFVQDFPGSKDLSIKVPLSYSEAVLGAAVKIPTPDSLVEIQIPANTSSGKTFRIEGQGLPDTNGGARGDLYAEVFIHVPEETSARQAEILSALSLEEDPENIRYRLFNPES